MMALEQNYTRLTTNYPPRNVPIEWITPSGEAVRGKWLGGMIWMPENSDMYVYYTPLSWRLVPVQAADPIGGR